MMKRYRKLAEDSAPSIDAENVPIINQASASEENQLDNMRPDVAIPDEVLERMADIRERAQARRETRRSFFHNRRH